MSADIVIEATNDADRMLNTVWVKITGANTVVVPVDPIKIALELHIDVFSAEMPIGQSAMIIKKRDGEPRIILNIADSPNRARFSCAHELGHYVKRSGDADFEYIDNRDELSGAGTNDDERYANAFAAELLMPREEVRGRRLAGATVAELAWAFDVSAESMQFRLQNLNLA